MNASQLSLSRRPASTTKANRALFDLCRTYYNAIPLDSVFAAASSAGRPVQEDGSPWSGLLCGREGRATFPLRNTVSPMAADRHLHLQWYRLESGRYEINAYVS